MTDWDGAQAHLSSPQQRENCIQGGGDAVKSGHQLARPLLPAVAISTAPMDNLNPFILPPYLCKLAHLSQSKM